MKKQHLIPCLALLSILLIHSPAHAGTFTAFGPKTFARGSGKPVVETASFNINNPNAIYTLHAYNGGLNSEYSKASGAVITLNGKIIFDFNRQETHLQMEIAVSTSNTLQVVLKGSPKSGVTIIIEGTDVIPPVISITSPANGVTVYTSPITVSGAIDDNTATVMVNGKIATVSSNKFTATGIPLSEGTNTITVTAKDVAGNISTTLITVTYAKSTVPPDPATIAPPVDKTVATTLASASVFLYTGENAIQYGVSPDTIEAKRVAVLRGKVTAGDGTGLSGVRITILSHPEYGITFTRSDGMFDMAVNGGGWLTVNYEKTGYLPSQRQVNAPWQDYAWLPEVVLIPFDTKASVVDLSSNTIQVAQGSTITDADGTRKSTLIFTPGTGATMRLPDDTWLSISNFTVRATEYTVDENGPKAMPGPLPPTSGYTYAAEYSIDEAINMGATYVSFNKPVISYVENFLNFPVGGIVPVGWYDRERGIWIPSDNGKIIKILSITNGMADIDIDGSNAPASSSALASLGIINEERQTLATLYQPGQSLWRVPISHFTPWDCNWPYGPPLDATAPQQPQPEVSTPIDDPCTESGSIIECQNQILGESINITGTPFSLNYRSNRVAGRKAANALNIKLSGASVPTSLKRIDLIISVAGRQFTQSFSGSANQTHTFIWDGNDAYGRTLQGAQPVDIRIGYVYESVYYQPSDVANSFATFSGITIIGGRPGQEATIWQEQKSTIGDWDSNVLGFGGWTLSLHHAYDAQGKIMYRGDGSRHSATDINNIITTVAGNGTYGYGGDGGPATSAMLFRPWDLAVDGQGNLFITDSSNDRIRKVNPDGIISTVCNVSGTAIAVDGQGNLFIAGAGYNRIFKVSPDGIITTVAGNGTRGYSGDGGPAISAMLYEPEGIAVDGQGNIFIADSYNNRIRKVSPDGIITTVAGTGVYGYSGDGGPATSAKLWYPRDVEVDGQGNLFISDVVNVRIRKVSPDGTITTVAGNGRWAYGGDGGPATSAMLYNAERIALDGWGNLFIADLNNGRIRKVSSDGIITTVAGNGASLCGLLGCEGSNGDGGPATSAMLWYPRGLAVDGEGNLYIADQAYNIIRKVGLPLPGFSGKDIVISSKEGTELYGFDSTGKHLKTVDSITGVTKHAFTYNASGYLTSITDRDGNITTTEREPSGNPTAIIASRGQRTELTLDASGYLASVKNPNGEVYQMIYTTDGLLTTFIKPKGSTSTFTYDSLGLLINDEDSAGGFKALSRTDGENSYTVAVTTAEGRANAYKVEELSTGASRRTNTDPSGFTTITNIGTDGTTTITEPDGTITTTTEGPDPRFGMQAPIITNMTVKTPSGLTYSLSEGRTVTLSDQSNPLSIVTMTDTKNINGKTYTSLYEAAQKKFTVTSPVGRQRFPLLDTNGRVAQEQTSGLAAVNYQYDAKGRLTTITQGARTSTISYDSLNQISSITDAAGRTVGFTYDLAGRVTQQTLPDSRVIAYSYDANGNVTSITPPGRPSHNFTFDPRDLETYYNPPDIGIGTVSTQYAYNLDKQLTQITRPDGQTISLNYDNGGRLSTMTLPTGQLTYSYSSTTGNLSSVAAPGETLSYSYDGSLLTGTAWTGAISGSVGFAYNNDFRVTSESVNGANSISYAYDNDGLLTGSGSLSISRDTQNGLITGSTLGSVTDSFSYSSFGEPNRYTASVSGSTLFDVQYTRDNLGRITSKTETVSGQTSTYAYTYDQAGRLTDVSKNGVNTAHYDYDTNGNRVGWAAPTDSGSATYDNQDRLVTYGNNTYSYTANGELQTKTSSGQTTSYYYDVLGNLKSATLADGTAIEYLVDGQNRRIGKKVNGALVQGFIYKDQLKPVAELDGTGNIVSRFVYGNKANVPEYMVKGSITYRIITDHLGSPRLVVNASTGAVAQQIDYDEYGNITNDTNPGFQPFGFAGGLYDRDTKLTRFGARDYDASLGRFVSKDPLRFKGGDTNLFNYVLQDPVNLVDPLGLYSLSDFVTQATSVADSGYTIATASSAASSGMLTAAAIGYMADAAGFHSVYLPQPFSDAFGLTSSIIGTAAAVAGQSTVGVYINAFGLGYTIGTIINNRLIDPLVNSYNPYDPSQIDPRFNNYRNCH